MTDEAHDPASRTSRPTPCPTRLTRPLRMCAYRMCPQSPGVDRLAKRALRVDGRRDPLDFLWWLGAPFRVLGYLVTLLLLGW